MDLREIGWAGSSDLGLGQMTGSCEYDNESSGSTKCLETLGQLSDLWLFKKATAP
jgi:hypothetical protein